VPADRRHEVKRDWRVWKVQLPLATNRPDDPHALVYDEDKRAQGMIPVDDGLLALAEGEVKFFLRGWISKRGIVHFDPGHVPDPGW
jgi:hypothetical protein